MRNPDFFRLATEFGVHLPEVQDYMQEGWRRNSQMAFDAQPLLQTVATGGIPAFLTQIVDPNVLRVLLQPNAAAQILGEVQKGSWTDQTMLFPVVERVGEVSTYGDFNENGHAGVNTMWPQRQAYLYQTMVEYGDLELERAGLAKLNWAAEQDEAAVVVLNKYQNQTYFYGVQGLQNYGLLNDPSLPAAITPTTKAAGGVTWFNGNSLNATANEVYNDVMGLFRQLVAQSGGLVDAKTSMVLAMSPGASVAMTATNEFGINVGELMNKNFPNIRMETAVQYSTNAGEVVQLIATSIEGQDTGYCAYNEKLRAHPAVRGSSSVKQKKTQGTWGAIIRVPYAFAQLIGV